MDIKTAPAWISNGDMHALDLTTDKARNFYTVHLAEDGTSYLKAV